MKHKKDLFPILEKHRCESYTRGNWIIYKCSECDYLQQFNWKTGKVLIKGNTMALHSGSHTPIIKKNPLDGLL